MIVQVVCQTRFVASRLTSEEERSPSKRFARMWALPCQAFRYDKEQFRLRLRDDGSGIDPAVLSRQGSEGHYGLPGMQERATIVGGELTVWSGVQCGFRSGTAPSCRHRLRLIGGPRRPLMQHELLHDPERRSAAHAN